MRQGEPAGKAGEHRRGRFRAFASWLSASLGILLAISAAGAAEPAIHKIAVVSIRQSQQTLKEWQSTADYLSQSIPGHRFVIVPVDFNSIEGLVAQRRVDFVVTNPANYAVLEARHGVTRIATLIRKEGDLALKEFGGVIFTKYDRKDIVTLKNLRNKTIAASNPTAYGSYMMQAFELLSAGIDPESDIKRLFVGLPQDNIVKAVSEGRADAGFVRDGLLEQMAAEGLIDPADFRVIGQRLIPGHPYKVSTILYPEWPFSALPTVAEEVSNRVAVALLGMPRDGEAARDGGYHGWSVPLNYSLVDDLMKAMRAPPYDIAEEIRLVDILRKYDMYFYSMLLVGLLTLIGVSLRFRSLNRNLSGQIALVADRSASLESEVASRLRAEARLADENTVLDQLAQGATLPLILDSLLHVCESEYPEVPAAILILDEEQHRFRLVASLNLGQHCQQDLAATGIKESEGRIGMSDLVLAFRVDRTEAVIAETVPDSAGRPIAQLVLVIPAERRESTDRAFLQNLGRIAGMAIERARITENLRLSASVFSNALEGIMVTDAEGYIVDVNPSFVRLTGYSAEEARGHLPSLLKSGRHEADFYRNMWTQLHRQGHWSGEIWNRRKDGQIFAEILQISGVRDAKGRLTHYVSTFSDITTLKETQQRLEKLASYDSLTGLPNRTLLADRLAQAMSQAKRRNRLLAVCFMDLDGFKPVNDSFGHDAGDLLLQEVGQRLSATLRAGDTVARLGGDEFVLLVGDLNDVDELDTGIRRVLDSVAAPFVIKGQTISLTTSIGITLFPLDDEDPDTLLRHADNAMYRAKQEGRNRHHMFNIDDAVVSEERTQRREQLRQAIGAGELQLYYQPKVSLREERVTGVEALLRWRHPELGLLQPDRFLPDVEHDDIICDIGTWVMREALTQQDHWLRSGIVLPVSVNIAARQLLGADFFTELQAVLADFPDRLPGGLEIEILESAAIGDAGRMAELIERCHMLDVRFALDDFGTGYSSLTHLQHLPADTLKIDRSFVANMYSSRSALAIIEAIVGLANAFQCELVAEGIETIEQGSLLARMGCKDVQGFFVARPMPAAELPAWMENYRPAAEWKEWSGVSVANEDFSLLLAEFEHRCWVNDLIDAIGGQPLMTPIDAIRDVTHCKFGRWLKDLGRQRYKPLAQLAEIDAAHESVHDVGRRILHELELGDFQTAQNLVPELRTASEELLATVQNLQRNAASLRQTA